VHQRADLLDAASEMLLERGYSGLRFKDVSRASGVPVASLRHYFPTLEVLRKDALRHMVRVELARMSAELARVEDPWARVRTLIETGIDLEPQSRRDGWVLWLEYWRAAAHHEELAADARELHRAWLEVLHATVVDGVEQGVFHLDQSPWEAAREFFALLDGFGLDMVVEHSDAEARAAITAVERAARRMLGMPAPT
jgi:AcrR family transcriptional regulator